MKQNQCMDCSAKIKPVPATGTWVCEDCNEKLINRLRKIAGGVTLTETKIEVAEKLLNKGLSTKEIADEMGVTVNTVYNYRSQIKKLNSKTNGSENIEAKTVTKSTPQSAKQLDGSKNEYEELEQSYKDLMEDYKEAASDRNYYKDNYEKVEEKNELLRSKINKLKSEQGNEDDLNKAIENLKGNIEQRDENIKKINKEKEGLKDTISILNESKARKEEALKVEKSKQEALFNYLILSKAGGVYAKE